MPDENFSPEQSLRVIQSMIERSKQEFSNNHFYLLLWGWLLFAAAVGHYVLMVLVKYNQPYQIWGLTWIGAIVSIVYGVRSERRERVKTYISETTKYFGIACGITFTIMAFVISAYKMWEQSFPIYFLMYGFMCFICGTLINFVPLRWAAAICWAIAVIAVFVTFEIHLLLMAAVMLVSFIIPGYLLKARQKKERLRL